MIKCPYCDAPLEVVKVMTYCEVSCAPSELEWNDESKVYEFYPGDVEEVSETKDTEVLYTCAVCGKDISSKFDIEEVW